MVDAVGGEQLAQGAVVDVGPGVVGLQPLGLDPVAGEERNARSTKPVTVVGALVGVDLGEGKPGVVVDDRVAELPANPGPLLGRRCDSDRRSPHGPGG